MLKKEQADKLKELGLDIDQLKEAFISEEEKEISIPEGKIYSAEQLKDFEANINKEAAEKGANTILEMKIKEYARTNNLEIKEKTIEGLTAAVEGIAKSKYTKGENERIAALEQDKKELQESLKGKDAQFETIKTDYEGKIKTIKADYFLESAMPKLDNGLNQKHLAAIFKTEGYSVDFNENGKVFIKKNGEAIKDEMKNFAKPESVIDEFIVSQGFKKTAGRNGDSDYNHPETFKDFNEAMRYLEKNNIDPGSDEGQTILKNFK